MYKCYHIERNALEFIDNLGYIVTYYIDEPMLDSRPHFHIFTSDGRNVAICYKENRYADPNNHDRLSDEECKILNDWMVTIVSEYTGPFIDHDEICNNWDSMRDSLHIQEREWINKRYPIQPNYTTINEPLPFYPEPWEIEDHVKPVYGRINIDGVGKAVYYEIEDSKMYLRPHFHVVTDDGRNVEICILKNRYANPYNHNRLTEKECVAFNNWVHSKDDESGYSNWTRLRGLWHRSYDNRCDIPMSAKICPDFSIIEEPLPLKKFHGIIGSLITIGHCNGIGDVVMFTEGLSDYYFIPHFFIQKLEDLIPIGIKSSVYLDPSSTRLNKQEREALMEWMQTTSNARFGPISNWDRIVISWDRGRWNTDKWKMPNYRVIRQRKISKPNG